MARKASKFIWIVVLLVAFGAARAEELRMPEASVGTDVVNRYIWRGLNVGDAPSVQPSIAFNWYGAELGAWGAYSLSNNATEIDEIDFWLSYTYEFEGGYSVSAIVTDYYYPNAGIELSNFNDADDEDGPGAHLIEIGASFTGPETFPITFSAFVNVHNEEGNNTYFQLDYPVELGDVDLNFFAGGTGGSEDNPYYYGSTMYPADEFTIINVGLTVTKEIAISKQFSLPVFGSFIVNPSPEVAYMVVGFSL